MAVEVSTKVSESRGSVEEADYGIQLLVKNGFSTGGKLGLMSVSYTHLDVYKRQWMISPN